MTQDPVERVCFICCEYFDGYPEDDMCSECFAEYDEFMTEEF